MGGDSRPFVALDPSQTLQAFPVNVRQEVSKEIGALRQGAVEAEQDLLTERRTTKIEGQDLRRGPATRDARR